MTHEIEGIIIPATHPARQLNGFRSAVRKTLRQGMVIVPLGDALIGEIGRDGLDDAANPFPEFRCMSASLANLLSDLSADGPVAYIETEYFGGAGDQAAAVWKDRELAFGPEKQEIGPINAALAHLGVTTEGDRDAFEAVGLHRHRSTEGWTHDR